MRSIGLHGTAALVEALLLALVLTISSTVVIPVARAGTSSIDGVAYTDLDADGAHDADDLALVDQQLYLFDAAGTYIGTTRTDAVGAYQFSNLRDGAYRVAYATSSWLPLRQEWVPSTTEGVEPETFVNLLGSATADFGWRRIGRSSDVSKPMSSFVGASGLTVKSYTDAVSAEDVHQLAADGLVGTEAAAVVVHLDLGPYTSTSTSVSESEGVFSGYRANVYISWESWLDDPFLALGHEYGHAWSLYFAYTVQADPALSAYIAARGLTDDPRLDGSYLWHRRELIAEDYRQLLGGAAAAYAPQANSELPPAASIVGLRDFLVGAFRGGLSNPVPTNAPSAVATPSATPDTNPAPTATPAPTRDAAPTAPPPPDAPTPSADVTVLDIRSLTISPTPVGKRGDVTFDLTAPAHTRIEIHDAHGALVRVLVDESRPAGWSVVGWNRKDDRGRRVKPGTYVLVITAADEAGHEAAEELTFRAG